jgi:hypothetical protein
MKTKTKNILTAVALAMMVVAIYVYAVMKAATQ